MNEYSVLIGRAADLAATRHSGDIDRDGLPHIFHCMRVAMKQRSPHAMIVALLHDLIEDAQYPDDAGQVAGMIGEIFGDQVMFACVLLTEVKDETYEQYISRIIASGNFEAMEIKKADIEDNTRVGRIDMKAVQKFPIYKAAHVSLCEALGIQSDLSLASQE